MSSRYNDCNRRSLPFGPGLSPALGEYRYLLERGYPERGSIQLVGDRHRLSGEQRAILYRGASARSCAEARRDKIVPVSEIAGTVYIDGYNIIYTVCNFRLGRPVFISDDGVVRDAGQAHKRVTRTSLFEEASLALCAALSERELSAQVYLDRPVSGSARDSELINRLARESGSELACEIVPSADRALSAHSGLPVASSDSAVIDAHVGPVVDLARLILESRYDAQLVDLSTIDQCHRG
ncbi:MAG TPA: DUF434 domain-containing protein [Spirochaetia bacterium]|nr:DUF434 domain-containing protein [Spirochaetia bacterium]